MPIAKIFSVQNYLLKPHLITIEIDISRGLHSFSIVGLAGRAIEEARDRVSAAIKNSGFKSPKQTNSKVTVSLAPANIKKEGPAFDLPIAIGYLVATGIIKPENIERKIFVGELALDGTIRNINGALIFSRLAQSLDFEEIILPKENFKEAALIKDIKVTGVSSLLETIKYLNKEHTINPDIEYTKEESIEISKNDEIVNELNFDKIIGQENAKRALVIALAGKHNIALYGPPGTGKTMLTKALAAIMPNLDYNESLEVTEIYSSIGNLKSTESIITKAPIRRPHHSSSYSAIIGGGGLIPKLGEVTLAHKGLLVMDEFPEFSRNVIEALREPLEEKTISISRVGGSCTFPTDFILIASMNPCPCGNKKCSCSGAEIAKYKRKLSGPIIDRIDIWIEVSKSEYNTLPKDTQTTKQTDEAKDMILRVRKKQKNHKQKNDFEKDSEELLLKLSKEYELSSRGFNKIIRLARTIADISNSEKIKTPHILEAFQYRRKDF